MFGLCPNYTLLFKKKTMKKNLLNKIKAMNKIAGTQLTKEQEIVLIKERLEQLNESESFVKKMEKLNPSWSKEKVFKRIENDYQKKEISKEEYKQYIKYAKKWFDKMEKAKPTVKVGDFVIVNPNSPRLSTLGKIVREKTWRGDYMVDGNPEPKQIPAWEIEFYREKKKDSKQEPINYGGKTYYSFGTAYRSQHEEGETFKKA